MGASKEEYLQRGTYLIPISSLEGVQVKPKEIKCLDSTTGEELSCRVYDRKFYHLKAALFFIGADVVHKTKDIVSAENHVFVFSNASYGDLLQYIREKKRLKEMETASLFRQIVELVKNAHSCGIALRDVKLEKFVFEDTKRTVLSLHYLDDAQLMDPSGLLSGRCACLNYVCPEMLQPGNYSGKAADLWSLGVILYTLLVGQYPFFDSSTQRLFFKVRSGYYQVPEYVSELARSLIHCLLTYGPASRMPARDVLDHPWFKHASDDSLVGSGPNRTNQDQIVPS